MNYQHLIPRIAIGTAVLALTVLVFGWLSGGGDQVTVSQGAETPFASVPAGSAAEFTDDTAGSATEAPSTTAGELASENKGPTPTTGLEPEAGKETEAEREQEQGTVVVPPTTAVAVDENVGSPTTSDQPSEDQASTTPPTTEEPSESSNDTTAVPSTEAAPPAGAAEEVDSDVESTDLEASTSNPFPEALPSVSSPFPTTTTTTTTTATAPPTTVPPTTTAPVTTTAAAPPTTTPTQLSGSTFEAVVSTEIFRLVNCARTNDFTNWCESGDDIGWNIQGGERPGTALNRDTPLDGTSKQWSIDVSALENLAHSPASGIDYGENVASYGRPTDEFAFTAEHAKNSAALFMRLWMDSQGHRDNLLADQWSIIGVGTEMRVQQNSAGTFYIEAYSTQQFL